MKRFKEDEGGALILEISMTLPFFMLVILFIYGLFIVNSTENQIMHAVVQSSKSLSMDPYLNNKMEHFGIGLDDELTINSSLGSIIMDVHRSSHNDPIFSSNQKWYSAASGREGSAREIAYRRFLGFLGGDESGAREKLDHMGIVGGADGLTYEMTTSGSDMTVTVSYTIQVWFDFWGVGKVPVKHSLTTRLWT